MKLPYVSIIYLFLFLASCSKVDSLVDQGLVDGILHFGNGSEPQGLDPHIVTGVPEHHLLTSLCEGLVIANPKGGDNLPGIASSWNISKDGTVYTFAIRENAKWSNGDPVTADDFVWSWMRILTPSLGSQYPDMLYYIKGAREYHQGLNSDFSHVGVRALDPNTLEVTLDKPYSFFIKLLSHYSTYPVHKPTVLKFGSIDDRNGEWTRPNHFVCNGPMNLHSWELNKKIVVKKNPNYWDVEKISINEVHFYPVSNESTEDRMFRAGQLHITNVIPQEKCPVYMEQNSPYLRIDPYIGTYFYRINTNHPVLKDKRVRQALSLSIDRELIVKKVSKCGQSPAYSFSPPGIGGYYPTTSINFDPEQAKKLLAEAGFEKGVNFPKLEILFNTQEGHKQIALAIQQMWQKHLGIQVELTNTDWKVYLSKEMIGDFQISRAGWIGDYDDPNTFLDLMRPKRGNNKTGWENLEYDLLIDEANSKLDPKERYEILNKAEAILIDEMPIIPIYTYVRQYQLSTDVKGWDPNPTDTHHLKYVTLSR
jgi:oligopeptide transport system substrate-binding protein